MARDDFIEKKPLNIPIICMMPIEYQGKRKRLTTKLRDVRPVLIEKFDSRSRVDVVGMQPFINF